MAGENAETYAPVQFNGASGARIAQLAECELDPGSLCGSWFHRIKEGTVVDQGVVVAEPQPGFYLLQLLDWENGKPSYQVVVMIADLAGLHENEGVSWRFYDSPIAMNRAYDTWVPDPSAD